MFIYLFVGESSSSLFSKSIHTFFLISLTKKKKKKKVSMPWFLVYLFELTVPKRVWKKTRSERKPALRGTSKAIKKRFRDNSLSQ
jgi:hypothetical protein